MIVDRDVLLARARLMRMTHPFAPATEQLVAEFGAVLAAHMIGERRAPEEVMREICPERGNPLIDEQALDSGPFRLIVPESDEWPASLVRMTECGLGAPLGLWVRGPARLADAVENAVAFASSTDTTPYGTQVAMDLAHDLAVLEIRTVVGASDGVEANARHGARGGELPAVMLTSTGLSLAAQSPTMLDATTTCGLAVSAEPLTAFATEHSGYRRCLITAALTQATVVVESRDKPRTPSASVDAAKALARPLLAVPGPVTSDLSDGPNRLLVRNEARAVRNAKDVQAALAAR